MLNIKKYIFPALLFCASCGAPAPHDVSRIDMCPPVFPDIDSITIPVDIAPINFDVDGADYLYVHARGAVSGEVFSQGPFADFDIDDWHSLTRQNVGESISIEVTARNADGSWVQYNPMCLFVSSDSLSEYGLTYRRIAPGYETFSDLGIFQRDIHTFDEFAIVNHTALQGECINCHVENRCNPNMLQLHVRGQNAATLYQINGQRKLLRTMHDSLQANCMYAYWHPSGRYIAYGNSNIRQSFLESARRKVHVYDLSSEIVVLDVETNELVLSPLFRKGNFPQYPSFSPKGDTLYFCQSSVRPDTASVTDIKYDLCAVSFDSNTGRPGNVVDTLYRAKDQGKSVAFPRPSYDGRFVVFSLADYSVFSIHDPASDLYIMDLRTRQARPFHELNSPKAESLCNWSTSSRWVVFTSRRYNNNMSMLYLAHVDEHGHASKPFMLPQRNPREYYHKMMHSYNVADFTMQKVDLDIRAFASEIYSDERIQVGIKK